MHFIISTPHDQTPVGSRQLIRRHVMIGKNRGKLYPNRKKTRSPHERCVAHAARQIKQRDPVQLARIARSTFPLGQALDVGATALPLELPTKSISLIVELSKIAKKLLFPLESCIFFDRSVESWLAPLEYDIVYAHIMSLVAEAFFLNKHLKMFSDRKLGKALGQAILLINDRLADEHHALRLADSTIAAILSLTQLALLNKDWNGAATHLTGIRTIIQLRGGANGFRDNIKLLIQIIQCDVGLCLASGSEPILVSVCVPTPASGGAVDEIWVDTCPISTTVDLLLAGSPLLRSWQQLLRFCANVNHAYDRHRLLPLRLIWHTMSAIFGRTLPMRFARGSMPYFLRLGLLTFSSMIFMHWHRSGLSYAKLCEEYVHALLADDGALNNFVPSLRFWLVLVAIIQSEYCNGDEAMLESLQRLMKQENIASWDEVQRHLDGLPWIPFIFKDIARLKSTEALL